MQEVKISRRIAALALVALFFFSFLLVTAASNGIAPSHDWTIRTVDAADVYSSSLAIDHNNRIHIAYYHYGQTLRYATNSGPYGNWTITIVDGMSYFGSKVAMALDSNNKAHISYQDGLSKELRYANNTGGGFVTRVIDRTGVFETVGDSIAVDSAGKAHISYVVSGQLKYATNKGGDWNITTIPEDRSVLYPTNIAIGSDDVVHIMYRSYLYYDINATYHYNVIHTWSAGGVRSYETIETFDRVLVSSYVHTPGALTVDSLNRPHFIYALRDSTTPFNSHMLYIMRDASGWSTPYEFAGVIGGAQEQMSLVTDPSNEVHIAYCDNEALRYVTSSGGWSVENIVTGMFGFPSIGMDSNGKLFVAYADPGPSSGAFHLKYATTAKVPSEPWNLQLSPAPGSLVVHWTAPNSTGDYPLLGYCAYLYNSDPVTAGAAPIRTIALPSTESSYAFTGLFWNGGPYYVSLAAANSAGNSNMSSIVTGSPADLPTAPYLFANARQQGVNLTWNAPEYSNGSAVTNYSISWGLSSGTMTNEIILGDVLTYEHLGLSPGTYYYKVRAKNGIGWGPYSSIVSMVVQGGHPGAPLSLAAVGGDGRVTLTWSPPASDGGSTVTRYDIFRGTTAEGITTISYAHVTGSTLTYVDTSVTNGQKYYYLVVATNSYGAGSYSDIVSATPQGTTPPTDGSTGDMTTLIVIAVVVIIAIIAAAYFIMSRRGGGSP